ncbi:Tetracycline resistance protein [Cladophialophora carrionii]|uniref:Tetracycline resistance protein n=1 Tax=Cladophialophora carrionii TaxID=86049 RepID=A0A1C1CV62_9EURO|nr:Tetracycline resistance protein [Cladophialophora carrionii]
MPLSLAVIGAGPAGLTLARLLQVSDLDVSITVFEHDASPTARLSQGGTLDLHTDTGLAALKQCGLWDEAVKHLRYDGEELTIADKNDTHILHMKGGGPKIKSRESGGELDYERPEMDREALKDLLLKSVNPAWVQWGKTLQTIDPQTGVLSFRDGTTAGPFDLVVGADGAWSKVRHVLTDVRPQYAGVCGFVGHIARPNEEYPQLSRTVGRGSYFAYSDGKYLSAQRMGDESIKVGVWLKKGGPQGESWPADMMAAYGDDEEKLKDKILHDFHDWMPKQRRFVKVATEFRPWPLYELPVGEFWEHKKGYTLIGDASSLMTPFAGEGVNKAMRDSLELAAQLEHALKANGDVDEAVRKYEENMFPRAKKWQTATMRNKDGMFSNAGPVTFLVGMVDDIAEEMGKDLSKGVLSWIPFKSMVWYYVVSRQWVGTWRRRLSGMIWVEE